MPVKPWIGRTAVITGASRGIGAAIAEVALAEGIRLGLCARGESPLAGREGVHAAQLDIRDAAAVEAFAEEVADAFGGIDLWINNAGVLLPIAPVRDIEMLAEFGELHISDPGGGGEKKPPAGLFA